MIYIGFNLYWWFYGGKINAICPWSFAICDIANSLYWWWLGGGEVEAFAQGSVNSFWKGLRGTKHLDSLRLPRRQTVRVNLCESARVNLSRGSKRKSSVDAWVGIRSVYSRQGAGEPRLTKQGVAILQSRTWRKVSTQHPVCFQSLVLTDDDDFDDENDHSFPRPIFWTRNIHSKSDKVCRLCFLVSKHCQRHNGPRNWLRDLD